jgi:hypothetical protein
MDAKFNPFFHFTFGRSWRRSQSANSIPRSISMGTGWAHQNGPFSEAATWPILQWFGFGFKFGWNLMSKEGKEKTDRRPSPYNKY